MSKMSFTDRRGFLKGLAGAAAGLCAPLHAAPEGNSPASLGVLVDTTRCLGCRACEQACQEANGLPEPVLAYEEEVSVGQQRDTGENSFVVVNAYHDPVAAGETIYRRQQCMHCLRPACVTACLVKSMQKRAAGPVIWDERNCIGCRYCMVSCPFEMPKFEYGSATPRVRKCTMCAGRLEQGKGPACVEACPAEALTFDLREGLLMEAKRRVFGGKGGYFPHVYGEHEAGGTSWLYLSRVPFQQIGLRSDLGERALPELPAAYLHGVSQVLVLWPALMVGLYLLRRGQEQDPRPAGGEGTGEGVGA